MGINKWKNVVITERDLKKIFPEENWNKLHLQIIFWGREFCTARSCFALECEICRACNPKKSEATFSPQAAIDDLKYILSKPYGA